MSHSHEDTMAQQQPVQTSIMTIGEPGQSTMPPSVVENPAVNQPPTTSTEPSMMSGSYPPAATYQHPQPVNHQMPPSNLYMNSGPPAHFPNQQQQQQQPLGYNVPQHNHQYHPASTSGVVYGHQLPPQNQYMGGYNQAHHSVSYSFTNSSQTNPVWTSPIQPPAIQQGNDVQQGRLGAIQQPNNIQQGSAIPQGNNIQQVNTIQQQGNVNQQGGILQQHDNASTQHKHEADKRKKPSKKMPTGRKKPIKKKKPVSITFSLSHPDKGVQEVALRFKKGCDCGDQNCYEGLNPESVKKHRINISRLTKTEHDMYLMGVIMASLENPEETARHRERKRLRSKYKYRGKEVCLDSFLFLENTTRFQLKSIRKHLMENGVEPRIHGNQGKKPHNSFSEETLSAAAGFLKEYLEKSREKNLPTKKTDSLSLPSHLTCKRIHSDYKTFCQGTKLTFMGYSTFKYFLKEQFPNVKIERTKKSNTNHKGDTQ